MIEDAIFFILLNGESSFMERDEVWKELFALKNFHKNEITTAFHSENFYINKQNVMLDYVRWVHTQ